MTITDAQLQSLVVDTNISKIDVNIQYTNITSPTIRQYVREFYNEAGKNLRDIHGDDIVTVKSTILSNLLEIRTMSGLTVLGDINHLFWYSYALAHGLESDVLALIVLINSVSDLKQWIGTVNSRRDIERFFSMHVNGKGDIYFLWVIWNMVKEILEKDKIYRETTIDVTLENSFKLLKDQYLRKTKIPFDQFIILDKMYRSGQLNTEDEFYHYLSYITLNSKDILAGAKESDLAHRLRIIAQDHKLNADKLAEFLSAYLDALFVQNKKRWSYQYQLENYLEDDETENTVDMIEWAKKTLLLPGINSNPNYELTKWDRILETYIRAFSTNLIKNETSHYLRISKGIRMDPVFWSNRLKIETTFLNNKTEYLIYHNTETTPETVSAIYLTPVKIEWVIKLNPLYYYYLFFDKKNPLNTMYPDEDVVRSIKLLEANKHLFNKTNLIAYLDKLGAH